ncbi:MAG: hypothetical protein ACFFDW_00105 [Candidatus Thorarchaeota archaeon]
MTLVIPEKKRVIAFSVLVIGFIVGQIAGNNIYQSSSISINSINFTNEELSEQIKIATDSLTSLFNEKQGIFLWNIQNPNNLSRYGDFSDLTNAQESLDNKNYEIWLDALVQDVSLQYLLLKNYISISLETLGYQEDYYLFNRDWMFMTERIIINLYYEVANNDQLIDIMNILSEDKDGFGEYWNTLIRPKNNDFVNERIALLPDTLELGSKLLRIVEFMPYFSFHEKSRLLTLSETVSYWWASINKYALYDPEFAIAGMGPSRISLENDRWIGWNNFKVMARDDHFPVLEIQEDFHLNLQRYIYTSPHIANQYLTYIKKSETAKSYLWNTQKISKTDITDQTSLKIFNTILDSYSNHIIRVRNTIVYVFDPKYDSSWIPLPDTYSGYTYYWDKYFIDIQGSDSDLYAYKNPNSPLRITDSRTYQGAGDIRGLIEIFNLLSNGFTYESMVSLIEKNAMNILSDILKSQRADFSYALSPYFGTSLDMDVIEEPLINDACVLSMEFMPTGLSEFTGSMSVFQFLLDSKLIIDNFGYEETIRNLRNNLDNTIGLLIDLLLSNIDPNTMGIPKQSIIGNEYKVSDSTSLYNIKPIQISVNLENIEFPDWVHIVDQGKGLGVTTVNQWQYLELLKEAYLITNNLEAVGPLLDALHLFNSDFQDDYQYQLLSICEVKDAIARTFFKESRIEDKIELNDITGIFGNSIPYNYRSEVLPVTSVFAAETPQKVTSMVMAIIPFLPELSEILDNPINQVVIGGFIFGVILTITVVYIRRPKHQ